MTTIKILGRTIPLMLIKQHNTKRKSLTAPEGELYSFYKNQCIIYTFYIFFFILFNYNFIIYIVK